MAFAPLESLILYLLYKFSNRHEYAVGYSLLGVISYAFQLSIIYELVRSVLRPLNHVLKAKTVGICVALWATGLGVFACVVSSHLDQKTVIDFWENRVSIFVSISICTAIIGVFLIMNRFYLALQKYALVTAQGLFIWHYSLLLEEMVHASGQRRFGKWYASVDYGVEIIYLAVLGYWIYQFWKEHDEQEPISAETRSSILLAYAAIKQGDDLEKFFEESRK